MLTAERLKQVLHYCPETGVFTRIASGVRAGTVHKTGYRQICIDGTIYREARLAFLYMNSVWPLEHVDHVNGDKGSNRWKNLREASRSQNMQNMSCHKDTIFGLKGVSAAKAGRYRARIRVDGRELSLGVFDDPKEAHAAYIAAAQKNFGNFARA